jgi:hypothetical protein
MRTVGVTPGTSVGSEDDKMASMSAGTDEGGKPFERPAAAMRGGMTLGI